MFSSIKEFFLSKKPISKLATKPSLMARTQTAVVEKATKVIASVPGGGITVTAIILTTLAFTMGHLLAMAAIAGIVMSISIACIYSGAPASLKSGILWVCAKFGWYLDVVVTVVLTILGFQLGATLGIVAMVLGLHISMLMSIARWYYARNYVPVNTNSMALQPA